MLRLHATHTYIFHIIFMMEDELKQRLKKEMMFTPHVRKKQGFLSFSLHVTVCLTLDMLGFLEYLARFSLDKLINGPSGLVSIEAWRNSEITCQAI